MMDRMLYDIQGRQLKHWWQLERVATEVSPNQVFHRIPNAPGERDSRLCGGHSFACDGPTRGWNWLALDPQLNRYPCYAGASFPNMGAYEARAFSRMT